VPRLAVIAFALVALVAAAAATAATPTQYRAQVNALCRSYTPKMKVQEAAMSRAGTNNEPQAYGVALGKLLVLQLAEDKRIEATPVPAALKTTMAPLLARLKKADALVREALVAAANGDTATMLTDLRTLANLAKPLNRLFDAAGLRDCGSKQT
jgi:hypothetical protein